jgi:hypothetical protein
MSIVVRADGAPGRRMRKHTSPDQPVGSNLYQIDVLCRDRVVVEQDGRRACLRPGDIAFIDPSRPARYVHSATRHVAMLSLRPTRWRD